jgi:hypothetical protein
MSNNETIAEQVAELRAEGISDDDILVNFGDDRWGMDGALSAAEASEMLDDWGVTDENDRAESLGRLLTLRQYEEARTMKYRAYAEHGGGASVGHPCRKGVYSDPADNWELIFDASCQDEAQSIADSDFEAFVRDAAPCDCNRNLCSGSERWWNSVSVIVEEA